MREQVALSQVTLTVDAEIDSRDGRTRVQEVGQLIKDQMSKHMKADWAVTIPLDRLEHAEKTQTDFTRLLVLIASISLFVGGIGIMNIMLATVTERTREIGIRKALGAPRRVILTQFLIEATLLSVIGGALGVAAALIGSSFQIVGVKPVIVPSSIGLALGVSIAIGLFFGGLPASRAARLRPIDALRYE